MKFFKYGAVVFAVCIPMLSACSTTAATEDPKERQQKVVQHWQACLERNALERNSQGSELSPMDYSTIVNTSCEGHKRDVIATFPHHQEAQVDAILSANAYQYLDNLATDRKQPISGDLVRTLLR